MAAQEQANRVTRTYRAAIRFGENYITLEETVTLALDASDEDIQQAVDTGWRIYQAQHESLQSQVAALSEAWGTPAPAPITPRDPDMPASEKQRNYIAALQQDLRWSSEQLSSHAEEHGVSLVHLTRGQASSFIDDLKKLSEGRAAYHSSQAGPPPETGMDALKEDQPVTERQQSVLAKLAQERDVDLEAESRQRFGVAPDELNNRQAGEWISEWQRR